MSLTSIDYRSLGSFHLIKPLERCEVNTWTQFTLKMKSYTTSGPTSPQSHSWGGEAGSAHLWRQPGPGLSPAVAAAVPERRLGLQMLPKLVRAPHRWLRYQGRVLPNTKLS